MPEYRADQAAIHLSVDGVTIDNVVWDKFEGGEKTADPVQYAPGGMLPIRELGNLAKRAPVTIQRAWSDILSGAYKALDAGTGNAAAKVMVTTLNAKKQPVGETVTYSGVIAGVTRPGYDHEGANTPAMLQVVINCDAELA